MSRMHAQVSFKLLQSMGGLQASLSPVQQLIGREEGRAGTDGAQPGRRVDSLILYFDL